MNTTARIRRPTDEEASYYSLNRRVYAIFARFYDAVAFPLRRLRHEVASMVHLRPDSRLLDVATGTGAQAFAFADRVREVVGIDLSGAMLRIARRKNRFPNVTFLEADATALPFDDASFDATCVSFALHEMPSSIRERVIREMARVTMPGGSIIVVDYALPQGRAASALAFHVVKLYEPDHYASFVKSDLAALLESAGIEALDRRSMLFGLARVTVGRKSADGVGPEKK